MVVARESVIEIALAICYAIYTIRSTVVVENVMSNIKNPALDFLKPGIVTHQEASNPAKKREREQRHLEALGLLSEQVPSQDIVPALATLSRTVAVVSEERCEHAVNVVHPLLVRYDRDVRVAAIKYLERLFEYHPEAKRRLLKNLMRNAFSFRESPKTSADVFETLGILAKGDDRFASLAVRSLVEIMGNDKKRVFHRALILLNQFVCNYGVKLDFKEAVEAKQVMDIGINRFFNSESVYDHGARMLALDINAFQLPPDEKWQESYRTKQAGASARLQKLLRSPKPV